MSLMQKWKVADDWRVSRRSRNIMDYTPNEREYRYEERCGDYTLKRWQDGEETTWRGEVSQRPEWLERILNTATVGGHLKRVNQPPPDAIVWFTTDADNNLKSFLELT
jgi:hypothetical protein